MENWGSIGVEKKKERVSIRPIRDFFDEDLSRFFVVGRYYNVEIKYAIKLVGEKKIFVKKHGKKGIYIVLLTFKM